MSVRDPISGHASGLSNWLLGWTFQGQFHWWRCQGQRLSHPHDITHLYRTGVAGTVLERAWSLTKWSIYSLLIFLQKMWNAKPPFFLLQIWWFSTGRGCYNVDYPVYFPLNHHSQFLNFLSFCQALHSFCKKTHKKLQVLPWYISFDFKCVLNKPSDI